MTVRVNGAVAVSELSDSCRPGGDEARVTDTVRGCSSTLVVPVAPPESVAVSFSSRWDGYSWSGAGNDPLETPSNVWTRCVWQLDGQWWMINSHLSFEAGSVPSSGSEADPWKEIVWPTFHVVAAV